MTATAGPVAAAKDRLIPLFLKPIIHSSAREDFGASSRTTRLPQTYGWAD